MQYNEIGGHGHQLQIRVGLQVHIVDLVAYVLLFRAVDMSTRRRGDRLSV